MLGPDSFSPNAFFSLSLLSPFLRANCAFLAPTSPLPYHPLRRELGDPRGETDVSSPFFVPLSLSLSLSALSSCRRAQENDDYKPLGLGVRLPRFCIKVDSNPSEIFSLSKLPLPRRIYATRKFVRCFFGIH